MHRRQNWFLKWAAPKHHWCAQQLIREYLFEKINFVVDNRGSVVESDFYTNLRIKNLDVQEGKQDRLMADYVTVVMVCEAHNQVMLSFLQQVQGRARPTTKGSIRILNKMCICNQM